MCGTTQRVTAIFQYFQMEGDGQENPGLLELRDMVANTLAANGALNKIKVCIRGGASWRPIDKRLLDLEY